MSAETLAKTQIEIKQGNRVSCLAQAGLIASSKDRAQRLTKLANKFTFHLMMDSSLA